jgi:hypothetical protein
MKMTQKVINDRLEEVVPVHPVSLLTCASTS